MEKTCGQLTCLGQAAVVSALFAVIAVMGVAPAAQAQSFRVLHAFTGGGDDATPSAGLTVDAAGRFYGVTSGDAIASNGSVFRLTPAGSGWILSPLNVFHQGGGGARPDSKAVIARTGIFSASLIWGD